MKRQKDFSDVICLGVIRVYLMRADSVDFLGLSTRRKTKNEDDVELSMRQTWNLI